MTVVLNDLELIILAIMLLILVGVSLSIYIYYKELNYKYLEENESLYDEINQIKGELKTKDKKIKEGDKSILKLNEELQECNENLEALEDRYKKLLEETSRDKRLISELQESLSKEEKKEKNRTLEINSELLESQLKDFMDSELKNLLKSALSEKVKEFDPNSYSNIESLLEPLNREIRLFREKIEHLTKEEAKELSALQNELKNIKELNFQLSSQAESLVKALRGDNKQQGIWGEMILSKVLELSGLEEGREYKREVTLRDNSNRTYRPDVIVYLPDNREVIIDAKTSLVHYQKYIESEDETEKREALKSHIHSIKRHIDNLSSKNYEDLEGINSLDFVFMFIPIDNALTVALKEDKNLFEYAFKNRVILVSPTTLLVSLRAIENSWRYEKQNKSIVEIIKSAEALYDKVRGFLEDFSKIGKSLDMAKSSFESAYSKLTTGRGNIIKQIEVLKEKANIKPKREIPQEFLSDLD